MAKSKNLKVEDLRAHFFMSIDGSQVNVIYHDDADNGAAIGAGFVSLMEQDKKLFDIFSAAMLTVIETKQENNNWERVRFPKKEKHISKKSNTVPKTAKKVAKKK